MLTYTQAVSILNHRSIMTPKAVEEATQLILEIHHCGVYLFHQASSYLTLRAEDVEFGGDA